MKDCPAWPPPWSDPSLLTDIQASNLTSFWSCPGAEPSGVYWVQLTSHPPHIFKVTWKNEKYLRPPFMLEKNKKWKASFLDFVTPSMRERERLLWNCSIHLRTGGFWVNNYGCNWHVLLLLVSFTSSFEERWLSIGWWVLWGRKKQLSARGFGGFRLWHLPCWMDSMRL